MLRSILLLALLAAMSSAKAQYDGPAVEACRDFAMREASREGAKPEDVVILRDPQLFMEKYARKVGSQYIASILTGNGSVVLAGTPAAELSFICLLADEKRAVFFNWLPRYGVSPLAQCTRSKALSGKSGECLEFLMRVAEQDLTQVYAQRFQEAREAGDEALAAYRKSNDEWKSYLEAECQRRRAVAPKGVSPDDVERACIIELMRQRGRDMRQG